MQIRGRCSLALLMFIHEMKRRAKVAGNLPADRTGNNSVAVRNILSALKKREPLRYPEKSAVRQSVSNHAAGFILRWNPTGAPPVPGTVPVITAQLLPVRQGKDALRE